MSNAIKRNNLFGRGSSLLSFPASCGAVTVVLWFVLLEECTESAVSRTVTFLHITEKWKDF
jgi:hypothetical protein